MTGISTWKANTVWRHLYTDARVSAGSSRISRELWPKKECTRTIHEQVPQPIISRNVLRPDVTIRKDRVGRSLVTQKVPDPCP